MDVMHRRVDLGNGIALHCAEAGTGPLVILLHGFPEHWASWRYQMPALVEAGFRAVAPDLRGYGECDKPRGLDAYRIDVLAEDVALLVTALGADRAAVVGHDWGGALAWYAAMWHPERVSRLVVLDCPHPSRMARALRTFRQWRRSWYALLFQIPAVPEALLRANDFALLRGIFRLDPARNGAYSAEDIEGIVRAAAKPGALTAMIDYYRASLRRRPHKRWLPIAAPTQVIWGQRDRYLAPELAAPDPQWVPDQRVLYIPGASHWVQADAPERVNEALIEFLRPLRG
ncbi:MAG: alpha/beta fold hydrolase [Myxococcales bacterium]